MGEHIRRNQQLPIPGPHTRVGDRALESAGLAPRAWQKASVRII